jgi:hypothetical protein
MQFESVCHTSTCNTVYVSFEFLSSVSYLDYTARIRMIVNWKGFGRKQSCPIRAIFWHSPKMAAENHENINQDR